MQKVNRSILASELYTMAHRFDVRAVIKLTIQNILNITLLSLIVCINLKSLYDYLVKLASI